MAVVFWKSDRSGDRFTYFFPSSLLVSRHHGVDKVCPEWQASTFPQHSENSPRKLRRLIQGLNEKLSAQQRSISGGYQTAEAAAGSPTGVGADDCTQSYESDCQK
jgi:hypothetical protein